jgi:hypothetical protein
MNLKIGGFTVKGKTILWAAGLLALCLLVWFAFQGCKQGTPAQPVSYTSQEKAQTPEGVNDAAQVAKVPISDEQAQEAAKTIQKAAGKPPDSIVKTTGANLQTAAASALTASGGDFAMITDPKQPNQAPVLVGQATGSTSSISYKKDVMPANQTQAAVQTDAIKPDDPVVLNQYNIQAYPQHLTVAHIGVYSAGVARLNKVNIDAIPIFLPKGGVGYVGPYVGITHNHFESVEHVDFGITVAF